MALPVRYTEHTDHETLQLTIVLERPMREEALEQLKGLIDSWFKVGLYGGYGGPRESGLEVIHDIEYDEEDLWVSLTVDAHHLGTIAVDVLARILEGFNNLESADGRGWFKELIVGFVVEE